MNPACRVDIPIGTPCIETGRQADDWDLATTAGDEEKGKAHQPTPIPDCTGEEICGFQDGHMHTDELPPGGSHLACGSGWDTVVLEDVPHRLVAHCIA